MRGSHFADSSLYWWYLSYKPDITEYSFCNIACNQSSRSSFSCFIHFIKVRPSRNLYLMLDIAYSGILLFWGFSRIPLLKFVHCMCIVPLTLLFLLLFPLDAFSTMHNRFSSVFLILCDSDLAKSCFFHFHIALYYTSESWPWSVTMNVAFNWKILLFFSLSCTLLEICASAVLHLTWPTPFRTLLLLLMHCM